MLHRLPVLFGRVQNVSSHLRGTRTLLTTCVEPRVSSDVPERPYTVVLAEDSGLYKTSWKSHFESVLPQQRGTQFYYAEYEPTSLEEWLQEMEYDLCHLPSVVFVARGPVSSCLAQYYLESLPLSGLCMVDPVMPPLGTDELQTVESRWNTQEDESYLSFLKRISRPLKLEPSPVAMFVVAATDFWPEQSRQVARRHSMSIEGEHNIAMVDTLNIEDTFEQIHDWIIEEI